jgi:hypothetical protein
MNSYMLKSVSTLGLKIGVAERLWLQLGVDTLCLFSMESISFVPKEKNRELDAFFSG